MNKLKQFRVIAILEGISYLLFALTMPLKYWYDMPSPNKIVGMFHGILFIAFIVWLFMNMIERKWKISKVFILFLSSLLPFGTFVADSKILSKEK
jgi:integral membrane protein